jgi:hypothetical protein
VGDTEVEEELSNEEDGKDAAAAAELLVVRFASCRFNV